MPDSTLAQYATKMIITEVTDVNVSEIVEADGIFTRAIRIYGTPTGQGIAPILEVQIKSDTEADLKFTTPELDF